ncbi:Phosphatidylserine/phosphatidylglycerophosphate/cardiolipin synthase [Nakamurella panacisegetis]|uniref:phospholipase D n=1 Tax=Nakamurella panacisegetis TaxID=1090615 RepID=A0A1H0SU54_9ACTN|nr:phosphatidylserine/phosphatidylglycerophosphate/cardiolipin synthase family protein [Nakamurella panacisegetis]SDP45322.1 Phosphatidylserine/phosphatidylglycerophosphate/cardiolipin synthase [Nakamurella panacisegetis]
MTSPIAVTFLRDTGHGGEPGQPQAIAAALAEFVDAARNSIDMAIYDFRLSDALAEIVVGRLIEVADGGVSVRIAYDHGKPADATAADFAALEADPAPSGTARWVAEHFGGSAVRIAGIDAGSQLMHSKYVVRDGAAVWTGSTNFTDDAWTLQENDVMVIEAEPVAAAYERDFVALWDSGGIRGTGRGDNGSVTLENYGVSWDFAPGDGREIDAELVSIVDGAATRLVLAGMVITSHPLLAALAAAIERGIPVSGIYDSGQMGPIAANWDPGSAVLADWTAVSAHVADKRSYPYTPTSPHNFMHHKVLVGDDTVVTGSYNFSANAERNAENQVRITDPALAGEYVDHIALIAAAYHQPS